jgi:hypothetical protein
MRKLVCAIKGHRNTRYVHDTDGHSSVWCTRCGRVASLFTGWRRVNRHVML